MNRALLALAVMLSVVVMPPAAHADDIECIGAIEGGNVEDVIVPAGAVCYMNVSTVSGSVEIRERATFISACSTIAGDVTADGAADVVVTCSTVGGRVQVVRGGEGFVGTSTVTGDVVFRENAGTVEVTDNLLGGNVQALKNTGGVEIDGNRIRGNLQCSRNDPRPVGSDNQVGGSKTGQCRGI